jgi:hypothetical protein
MNKLILLFLVLSLPIVLAESIEERAELVKGVSVGQTIYKVKTYIKADYDYHFEWYPQGVRTTFRTKIGDCTDYAMLAEELFRLNKIKTRLVHGYCHFDKGKHDWVEVWDGFEWRTLDIAKCDTLRKTGSGIW